MANFAKWIGGGLGFYVYGPAGGLLGFLLGSFFDETLSAGASGQSTRASTGSFRPNLIALVASLMQADGKVVRAELDYVKQFFVRQFGEKGAREALAELKSTLNKRVYLQDSCLEVRSYLDYQSRMQLLHVLFNLAGADGLIGQAEMNVIDSIAGFFGVSQADYSAVRDIYVRKTDTAYKVLGVEPTISNDELKKVYRKLAMTYHPDKVSHMGEEKRKSAEDSFKKLNEAYENIKKERNLV